MSINAGQLLHIGGLSLIDRVQSAGLGTVRVPMDTIREVGNKSVVEKVPQEPDFTFTLESFDMSAEFEAFLMGTTGGYGEAGTGPTPAGRPGASDADGTVYDWQNVGFLNVTSPWKDGLSSAGAIVAGHMIPGYFPTRLRYRFGVTENASQSAELSGGSFYYAGNCPVEEYHAGDGATLAFPTAQQAVPYRIGGVEGTTFKSVFGVIVNGQIMSEGVDYVSTPSNSAAPATATVTFTVAPAAGANIRLAYFTTTPHAFPDTDLADTTVKPGAVRGRHVCVYIGSNADSNLARIGSIQTLELDAAVNATMEREMCNTEIVGVTVTGFDCTGNFVTRAKNPAAFLGLLSRATGVSANEVLGWLNTNKIPLTIQILNPKNPGQVLKTLYVPDAMIQPPGTEARVNQPTDYTFAFESNTGRFQVIKGAFLP